MIFSPINDIGYSQHVNTWNDVLISSLALGKGAVSPTQDVFKGTTEVLQFSDVLEDTVFGSIQMPHDWNPGTSVVPHVHWSPMGTGTGDIVWGLKYILVPESGDSSAEIPDSKAHTISSNSQYKGIVTTFATIDMTGYGTSTVILFQLWRETTGNTLAGLAALFDIDFHYQSINYGTATP